MCTSLGWTWEYVENYLTMQIFISLQKYWRINPPVHLSVARYLGYKAEAKQPEMNTSFLDLPDVEE